MSNLERPISNFRLHPLCWKTITGLPASNCMLPRVGTYPLVLVVVTLAALYFLFAPRVIAHPDETWLHIQTDHVLRIGIDPSFPPFEADDGQGHLSGFDITLAYALAEKFSADSPQLTRIEYVYTGFDGLYDGLAAKQYDLILSALSYNPQKTQDVNFSHSYFDGGPVIIVPDSGTAKKQLSLFDLYGKRVAVELGSTGDQLLRKWTHRLQLDARTFDTTRAALDALQANDVDAALVDSLSFGEFQRDHPDATVSIASAPLEHEYFIIAVRKDSPTLMRNINDALDEWKLEGRLDALMKEALCAGAPGC